MASGYVTRPPVKLKDGIACTNAPDEVIEMECAYKA